MAAPLFGGADPLKVSSFLGFTCILVLEIRGINAGSSAHPEALDCRVLVLRDSGHQSTLSIIPGWSWQGVFV